MTTTGDDDGDVRMFFYYQYFYLFYATCFQVDDDNYDDKIERQVQVTLATKANDMAEGPSSRLLAWSKSLE